MATFNTYNYEFLIKCLAEGSVIFKAQSIKRLTVLAGSDKKQFNNYIRTILDELLNAYKEDKQEINYLATMLLAEVINSCVSKETQVLILKHLQYLIASLGHPTKTNVRKASHTALIAFLKAYHNFEQLCQAYVRYGFNNQNQLIQQKSINSFQSLLILEVKLFNWNSKISQELIEMLAHKVESMNLFVSKAASQCLLSFCKIEAAKSILPKLSHESLQQIKIFLDQVMPKLTIQNFFITPADINSILNFNVVGHRQQKVVEKEQSGESQKEQVGKSLVVQRRLQKIKKSIKNEQNQKIQKKQKESYGGRLFNLGLGQGTLKERTEAIEELLYKVQVSKGKPDFQASIKFILPQLMKMLKDTNPKIVNITLRILQHIIEPISATENSLNTVVGVIVEKLGDQKISIRQSVSKVIKQLANKTNKGIWIRELLQNLKKNTSAVLKDQTLYLIHQIYQNSSTQTNSKNQIDFPTAEIIHQIAHFTDDPKTKIKIRTLDCLAAIVFCSTERQKYSFLLKGKMSTVFYQMFLEKLGKLDEEQQKLRAKKEQKTGRLKKTDNEGQSYRTVYNESKALSDGEEQLNLSMETVKKRVSLVRKPRNLLSTQETISVDHSRGEKQNVEQVQIMLPSLYKKTGNRFLNKKAQMLPKSELNKTIETNKPSDYLSKEDLKPLRDPDRQMRNIMQEMKSGDWKVQFEAINKFRRLIQFHPQIITDSPSPTIHSLVLDMTIMVENLRSSVSKNSLICLYEFTQLMGKQIDPQIDILLEKLIKKAADTNIFISAEVQKCLNTLATMATPNKILQKLALYRESKSISVKDAIVETLIAMKNDQKIKQKQPNRLAEAIGFYLLDGQLQIRNKAKAGIVSLCKGMGDWYRSLRGKVNPICFKSICELMTKTNLKKDDLMTTMPLKSTQKPQIQEKEVKNSERQSDVGKKRHIKISQFPNQFGDISGWLDGSNSSDWKKRVECVNHIKDLALQYPNEFTQYKSAPHFIDVLCRQINEPNVKVTLNAMNIFLQFYECLRILIDNNLAVISNSLFTTLSSSKQEVRQLSQKCTQIILKQEDISLILQHLCQGILYSLPRSRLYLLVQLTDFVEDIYANKRQLLFKYVFPLCNKLMQEYKAQLMPQTILLFERLYSLMGNQMFSHLTKFKQVRQLISK